MTPQEQSVEVPEEAKNAALYKLHEIQRRAEALAGIETPPEISRVAEEVVAAVLPAIHADVREQLLREAAKHKDRTRLRVFIVEALDAALPTSTKEEGQDGE